MRTFQEENWTSEHGDQYNTRNPKTIEETDQLYLKNYNLKRSSLNEEFLGDLKRDIKILEVGCNMGAQLDGLKKMGFTNLFGIDVNRESLKVAKNNFDAMFGSALDLPFKDNYFDLVFTSGVLIHISPKDLKQVTEEIVRCSKKYIWGFEYFSDTAKEIPYRGKENLLWKNNFSKFYLNNHNLDLIKEKRIQYLNDKNEDVMFLLKKK